MIHHIMKQYQIIVLIVIIVTSFFLGTVFGIHLDWTDPDMECKKWVGIVAELAEQDYTYLIDDALKIAELKCGIDVDDLTS